ncbi:trafficking protein particle complex subunit 8-like isoform X2 [Oscarella lobularis]|uniref:trafficking protein particle complex subunit 8-like isoform X2 n=1 Tax=Oscarella lobularis TaxID=121494 RepID=UPI003313BAEB
MANCAQNAKEFIKQAFGPRIAIIASPDAEKACQKNNLSFVELLKPFCRPSTEGQIRDLQHQLYVVQNLLLHMSEPQPNPPPAVATKKLLDDVVARCHSPVELGPSIQVGDMRFNASTPWFEVYRKAFCENMRVSDHEFIRHYVACIFVVSTNHSNPIDEFTRMLQKQMTKMKEEKYPKYIPPNHVFFYRLLLHDVLDGNETRVQTLQNDLLTKYGPGHSHTLKINSRSAIDEYPAHVDPWSQYMIADHENDLMMESIDEGNEDDIGDLPGEPNGPPDLIKSITPVPSEAQLDKLIEKKDPLESESIKDPLTGDPLTEASDPLTKALRESSLTTTTNAGGAGVGETTMAGSRVERALKGERTSLRQSRSGAPSSALVYGQCLTLADHDRIRAFVNEFANRGWLPFVEKSIRTLSEQVNTRKGFQRTLFSVGKKWFGGGAKPSNQAGVSHYLPDSSEMQMRLLGDLAFLAQNYDVAYSSYHTCKRDFQTDHAWSYYAGALELAATALFMQTTPKRDPLNYFEESITVYLSPLKMHPFATRATLLATEYMKSKALYRDAAAAFIKLTGEDSDLKGGLLLEQAAHCFLRMSPSLVRKYAFHLILSGHRFSKAYQRRHALRMYGQALEVYQDKSWSLAEDHINLCLGHQSYTLKQLDDAEMAFRQLLSHKNSLQPTDIQKTLIKEFLFVFKQHLMSFDDDGDDDDLNAGSSSSVAATKKLPFLPLPRIMSQRTRVLLCGVDGEKKQLGFRLGDEPTDTLLSIGSGDGDESALADVRNVKAGMDAFDSIDSGCDMSLDDWKRLEEKAVRGKSGGLTRYAVQTCFDDATDNSGFPICVEGEKVLVELLLENSLQIRLFLGNVSLLWECKEAKQENEAESDESDNKESCVVSEVLEEFVLPPSATKPLRLSLTPLRTGTVNVIGIVYNLKARGNDADDEDELERKSVLQKRHRSKSNVDRMLSIGVRGKQIVYCKGPRLNRDKKERSMMAYGPDYRLSLNVVSSTAQLRVTFSEFPDVLLCGEVKLVQLELSNCGSSTLENVRVASSCPKFFSFGSTFPLETDGYPWPLEKSSGKSKEDIGLSFRRQPIAPSNVWPCKLTLPDGKLIPGGSATLPMWIYGGDETGVHQLDLLFVYDVHRQENTPIKYRVLKHFSRLSVLSSLKVGVKMNRTLPERTTCGVDSLEEKLAFLSVENVYQSTKERSVFFQLLQLSALSRHQLCLGGVSGKIEDESVRVQPKETFLLGFRTSKRRQIDGEDERNGIVSNILFENHEIVASLSPCIDLFIHSPAGETFQDSSIDAVDGNTNSVSRLAPIELAPSQLGEMKASKKKEELDAGFIVLWRAVVCAADGTRQLFGQSSVLPSEVMEVNSAVIHVSLSHRHSIQHDFNRSRICFLPLTVHLQNTSNLNVNTILKLLPPADTRHKKSKADSSPDNLPNDCLTGNYTWVGSSVCHSVLIGQEETTVQTSACFTRPGVYDLSRMKVDVVTDGGDIVQFNVEKSYVTVENLVSH